MYKLKTRRKIMQTMKLKTENVEHKSKSSVNRQEKGDETYKYKVRKIHVL